MRRNLPPMLSILALVVCIIMSLFLPISDLECSQADGVCSIYSGNMFEHKQLTKRFRISDVEAYRIQYSHRRRSHSYNLELRLKNGNVIIFNDFGTQTYARSENIWFDMQSKPNFKLKGRYLKTMFDWY